MTDTFKVPLIPQQQESETDDSTETKEVSHASFVKPELPPANFSAPIRHKNLQYIEPESSAIPPIEYTLEVLRNGSIIDYVALSQRSYTVFGRAPDSDVVLEHPTISRYHAIIQYKSDFENGQSAGLYLYDCNSTHGTFINKKRIEPKMYVRIKIGHIIKFGQSTRLYILQGDASAEANYIDTSNVEDVTHEQMKAFHAKRAKAMAAVRAKRESEANESNSNVEMDWGMGPEMDESAAASSTTKATTESVEHTEKNRNDDEIKKQAAVDDLKNRLEYQKAKNDQAVLKEIMSKVDEPVHDGDDDNDETKKEPFYLKDPKRALTAFFEREGAELVYDVEDHQFGSYRCTIKLPIVDEYGRAIQAECEQKHCKRKEIIHQCILEACRILDEHGVLREGTAASSNTPRVQQIKRQLLEENDFYEEDEDTFYDRTGDLEKKRLKRMERAGHLSNETQVETFDSLCFKLKNLYNERVNLEHQLEQAKQMEENAAKNAADIEKSVDEIDLYIRQLKQGEKLNMKVKWQWKKRLLEIENEERQYAKLLKVCKPKEFDILTWKQKMCEEAKQKLIAKPLPISSFQKPEPPKRVVDTEQMPPPPPPAPVTSSEAEPKTTANPAPYKQTKPTAQRKARRSDVSSKDEYDDSEHYSEDKFAGWMPPENEQTGDGRTALNDKYGY